MVRDLSDNFAQNAKLKKQVERIQPATGGGDSSHAGAGDESVQLGPGAEAVGDYSTAIGSDAYVDGFRAIGIGDGAYAADEGTALGNGAVAEGQFSTALGRLAGASGLGSTAVGAGSSATNDHEIMLGTGVDTVVVPGTFSNPSARRLKQNIIPAPSLRDIFPELTEWEYIAGDGRRRIGYIADDLLGTDAERFVTFDNEGRPAGIDYLSLLVAQVATLNARITELERG